MKPHEDGNYDLHQQSGDAVTKTPTDKVRAALKHAEANAQHPYVSILYSDALRELDGMVLVPVEPTEEMLDAGVNYPNDEAARDACRFSYKQMTAKA